jgi:hypothetical protein
VSEGLRAALDRITDDALPLARDTVDVQPRARAQVEIANKVIELFAGMEGGGYLTAFYDTACIAGCGAAQPISPRRLWEEQLRPKLVAAFAQPKLGDEHSGGEAAEAIAEHAFRAGFKQAVEDAGPHYPNADTVAAEWEDMGWSNYDPPEHIKAMS